MKNPTFHEERELLARGFSIVAGVDEVGCGCWAGPVYAAAVILPFDSGIGLIRDSKKLSPEQRARMIDGLKGAVTDWAVGSATVEEIDRLNIRRASTLAMKRAVENLQLKPQFVLADAFTIPGLGMPMKAVKGGDATVKSIAAASIIAKVERDEHMNELDKKYPGYAFCDHKGYGTKKHQEALRHLGPCPVHRSSFAPVKACLAPS